MYNVKMQLLYVSPYNAGIGTNTKSRVIKLSTSELFHIPCKRKSKDNNAAYAILVNTYEDLESIWKVDHTRMEFVISAKHSLSGFNNVMVKHYLDKDVVLKYGKFEHGDSLKVIEEQKF